MRFRLGAWAVAAVLALSSCGVDGDPDAAPPAPGDGRTELDAAEMVSARDTLPPAPPSSTSLTVLLTHTGDAAAPGLDAAAAALAERPDIRVVIALPEDGSTGTTTMSGFPVVEVASGAGLVVGATAATGLAPDLVVVGIGARSLLGGGEPLAAAAADGGVPALVVGAEGGQDIDLAAAAMQLLEVLDLELDAILGEPAAVHRLTVPSCRAGILRPRLAVRATASTTPLAPSDCTTEDRSVPSDEVTAVGAGHVALARLP